MTHKISRRPQTSSRFLTSFLAGLFILAAMINSSPLAMAQTDKGADVSTALEAAPESPSLILVPNGMAVTTSTGADGGSGGNGPTLRVVDISQFGNLWPIPANRAPNYISTTGQMPLMQSWLPSQFNAFSDGAQSMRGLAISGDGTKIYAAASGYTGNNKTPNIYIIGPGSVTPVLLATLPSYVANVALRRGIAGLDLDETHNAVFAASLADGIIYRRDATTGANLGSFDPLTPYVIGTTTLPPLGERVIAVAYNKVENRLYYSIWGSPNSVRSVGLTALGAFDPLTDRLEFNLSGSSAPVADIEFNNSCNRMLMAEENLIDSGGIVVLGAHGARGLEYTGGTTTWVIDPTVYPGTSRKYSVGAWSVQTNCRGGIAWAYSNITGAGIISGNESFVMFTGDALRLDSAAVYGLQYTPSSGGAAAGTGGAPNSLIADLDYDVAGQDKSVYGDVDIRRNLSPTASDVTVSGTVYSLHGKAVSKATLTLTDMNGQSLTAMTNPFGYYEFTGVSVGQTYTLSVTSKGHTFAAQLLNVQDAMAGVDFTSME